MSEIVTISDPGFLHFIPTFIGIIIISGLILLHNYFLKAEEK